jgi:hypothetical protein
VNESNWLNDERPSNWTSPVNYAAGSVHIRVEVLEKPAGSQQVGWALCYVANAGNYGCPYTPYYSATGVYERDVNMQSFWSSGPLDWSQGLKQVDLVYTINSSGSGHVDRYPDLKDLTTPTRVRITMVQVSEGATYDPSILDTNPGTGGSSGDSGAGGASGSPGAATGGTPSSGGAGSSDATAGTGGAPMAAAGGSATSSGGAATGNGSAREPSSSGGCAIARSDSGQGRLGQWLPLTLLALLSPLRRWRHRRRTASTRSRSKDVHR